jgi:putative FmdB family regulatory protein
MIYEYGCNDCGHRFEVWAKVSEPAPESCPQCHQPKIEKIISATAFALKGSGWYTSDYKRATIGAPGAATIPNNPVQESPAPKAGEQN